MKQRNIYGTTLFSTLITILAVLAAPVFAGYYFTPAVTYEFAGNSPPAYVTNDQDKAVIKTEFRNSLLARSVFLRGEGFSQFETVELSVHWTSSGARFSVVLSRWLVVADAKGRFETEWAFPGNSLKGERLQVFAYGKESGTAAGALLPTESVSAGADIDQCANGGIGNPPVQCIISAWQNGNLNSNQAHYIEGQVVPFRMKFTGLSLGTHTVEIGYDTTENGKHAYDFLATYKYTETTADPCDAGTTCTGTASVWNIPDDPNIPLAAPINPPEFPQADRQFTMWGGTITSVGDPAIATGDYTTTSRTTIVVTFTANVPNPVLAWGGHLARRGDWGNDNSAAAISGSPYHMRLIALDGSGGNQDRSIQSSAVIFPARIMIYKHASPPSQFVFSFTATNLPVASFTLVDNSASADPMKDFADIQDFTLTRRIAEASSAPYTLRSIGCTVVDVSGITGSSATVSLPYVDIVSKEASTVTCTFFNDFATAATVLVSGRVLDPAGRGLPGAFVSLTNPDGVTRTARTNSFGFYILSDVEAGSVYYLEAAHKQYLFNALMISISGELKDLNIYPVP